MSINPPSSRAIRTKAVLESFIVSKKFIIAKWADHVFKYLKFYRRTKPKTKPKTINVPDNDVPDKLAEKSLFHMSICTLTSTFILDYKMTQDEKFFIVDISGTLLIYEIMPDPIKNFSLLNHKMLDHKHLTFWERNLNKKIDELNLKLLATITNDISKHPNSTLFDIHLHKLIYVFGNQVIQCDLEKISAGKDFEKCKKKIFSASIIQKVEYSPDGLLLIRGTTNLVVLDQNNRELYSQKNLIRFHIESWSGEVLLMPFKENNGMDQTYGTYLIDVHQELKVYKITEIIMDSPGFVPYRLSNQRAKCIGEGEFQIKDMYNIYYFYNYNNKNLCEINPSNTHNFTIYDDEYYYIHKDDIIIGKLPMKRGTNNFKKIILYGLAEFDRFLLFPNYLSTWAIFIHGSKIYDPRILLQVAKFSWI